MLEQAANATQVGGSHYVGRAIQPWDYIVSNELGYLEGNVVKYVSRHRQKGGLQDLQKARHYLDKLIEVEQQRQAPQAAPEPPKTVFPMFDPWRGERP